MRSIALAPSFASSLPSYISPSNQSSATSALSLALLAAVTFLTPTALVAETPAFTPTFTALEQKQNTQTIGWRFTAHEPIEVTMLGVFDAGRDGLMEPHEVGIWAESNAPLLVSGSVPSGTTGVLTGDFRYVSVPSIILTPGSYVIGAFYRDGGPDWNIESSVTVTAQPEISHTGSRYSAPFPSGFTVPNVHQGAAGAHFGPNFQYTNAEANPVLAESTFDSGTEQWTSWDAIDPLAPNVWYAGGGSPGGFIQFRETGGEGATTYFSAPAKFLGHQGAAYAGTLECDLRNEFATVSGSNLQEDIILIGSQENLQLVYRFPPASLPETGWTGYVVPLRENAGWVVNGTSNAPSATQLISVLSDLRALLIRGEFNNSADDRTDLDSVRLIRHHGSSSPVLTTEKSGPASALLRWPVELSGQYRLQTAFSLDPSSWSDVTLGLEYGDVFTTCSVSMHNQRQFFRLQAPHVEEFVPLNASWRYSDTGADRGEAWRETSYDDSGWSTGVAQLGFGDGDELSVINGGPPTARFPTTYFRQRFDLLDRDAYSAMTLSILRDDGAIVYLNGREVLRSNMPADEVDYHTLALPGDIGRLAESFVSDSISLPAWNFVNGTNVIAVEVHQVSATSSDLSFAMSLSGTERSAP